MEVMGVSVGKKAVVKAAVVGVEEVMVEEGGDGRGWR